MKTKEIKNFKDINKLIITEFPEFVWSDVFDISNIDLITVLMDDFGDFISSEIDKQDTFLIEKFSEFINLLISTGIKKNNNSFVDVICTGIFEQHSFKIKNSILYNFLSEDSKNILNKFN